MIRAQAYALSVALEGQQIDHQLVFSYDAAGDESASASLDPSLVYTGPQLAALSNYCAAHALNLTITVAQMGVT